jgi:hypothetical protein
MSTDCTAGEHVNVLGMYSRRKQPRIPYKCKETIKEMVPLVANRLDEQATMKHLPRLLAIGVRTKAQLKEQITMKKNGLPP